MVSRLVALAGLSGAGKSTAVARLVAASGGTKMYLGDVVLRYRGTRGFSSDAAGERLARIELQALDGPAFAVVRMASEIRGALDSGVTVVVDAAFRMAEVDELVRIADGIRFDLLAIEASFETRAFRLARRTVRPLTQSELRERDQLELENIGTRLVLDHASGRIVNDGCLAGFEAALVGWLSGN